ncbi:NADH kinase [Saccharomycopsis crataegensis]|uniref:NADH kinase n=1 Tax=Saccharomycopsis crataegensis TaxID=43959 RepID=A0AAV5QRY6_9ASCO|nr:NADH kinase [Saccharomycopsis crataegensis]
MRKLIKTGVQPSLRCCYPLCGRKSYAASVQSTRRYLHYGQPTTPVRMNRQEYSLLKIPHQQRRAYTFDVSQLPLTQDDITISNCSELPDRVYPRYESVSNSKLKRLIWPTISSTCPSNSGPVGGLGLATSSLRNVFVMKKPYNHEVTVAMNKFIKHLATTYPHLNIILTEKVVEEILDNKIQKSQNDSRGATEKKPITLFTGSFDEIVDKADLLVTLGGDGTILKSTSLFAGNLVPPVLSFSLGTLGFLLPYDFSNFKDAFAKVYSSNAKVLQRSRLECHILKKPQGSNTGKGTIAPDPSETITYSKMDDGTCTAKVHAMNDIILHRGSTPHLATLDVYVDGQFLTRATGDGLVISSPTGSTAYSLSAGGSIVHPLVKCILLTPICPRSLSFRPLIVPSTSHIKIKIQRRNNKFKDPCSKNGKNPVDEKQKAAESAAVLANQVSFARLSIDGSSHVSNLAIDDEIHIVNEIGTIFIPGSNMPDYIISGAKGGSTNMEKQILRKLQGGTAYGGITSGTIIENEHKGIHCVARSENDWTSGINELLGFNSRFKETRERVNLDLEDDDL